MIPSLESSLRNITFTPKEFSVISLMASGLSDAQISVELHFSQNYIPVLINRIVSKYNLHNRYQLVAVFVFSYLRPSSSAQ